MKEKFIKLFDKREEEGRFVEALQILQKLKTEYPRLEKSGEFYELQGKIFFDLENYEEAILSFKNALKITPSLERASLGIYISFAELEEDEKAIAELDRFLNENKADLYRATLEELLEGLENGYGTDFKDVIFRHSETNDVRI